MIKKYIKQKKKKGLLKYALLTLFAASSFAVTIQAQTIAYSENFTSGSTYCPGSTQYDNWGTFRSSLDTTANNFFECTIKGSLDVAGITCTDAAMVRQIAEALRSGTEQSFTCNGIIWTVGNSCTTGCSISGDDIEINAANTGSDCSCGGNYTVRPCIGNANWGSIGVGGCGAATQLMEVEFSFLPPYDFDAGITAIHSPNSPYCTIDSNVSVTLKQFGLDTLTSADIGWSVNGSNQTIFNWTGSLQTSQTEDSIFIGTYSFSPGDELVIWSTNPNSVLDSNSLNDTIRMIIPGPSMSGTYTIDTTLPTAGTNFNSFADAIYNLDSLKVCDSVLIIVTPGVYTEQISIPEIFGTSMNSPVIFRGDINNNGAVVLDFSSTSSSNNYTMEMDGADWFGFESMTFSASGTSFSRVVEFADETENNWMSNCVLNGNLQTTSTSTNFATLHSNNSTTNNNVFSNCTFTGGSYGVYWRGVGTADLNQNNRFDNCYFINNYYMGANFRYNNNLIVNNCTYHSNSTYTGTSYGIYNENGDGNQMITNNKIEKDSVAGMPRRGIYINNCDGTNTEKGLIFNNSVLVGDSSSTSSFYGIYVENSGFQNLYHNTVISYGGGNSTRTIYISSGGANSMLNNNITNFGNGYGIYLSSNFALINSNNNNIYAPNSNVGYFGADQTLLQDWLNSTGFDNNSVSVNANFIDWYNNDFHICNDTLNNAGVDLQGLVTSDLDGQTRNQTSPDLGADEFTALNSDIFTSDTINGCIGDTIMLWGVMDGSNVWSTGDTTSSISVITSNLWSVTVGNSCGNFTDSVVTNISSPTVSASADSMVSCNGLNDGVATASITGGTAPYTILWSNSENTASISTLSAGTYFVNVTDNNGCMSSANVTITSPSELVILASVDSNVSCTGVLGGASVILAGGTSPYSYLWSNNSTTMSIDELNPGIYSITVTDDNGCFKSDSITVLDNTCVGIENNLENVKAKYFPNPTTGVLNMELTGLQGQNIDLTISNIHGKTIFSESIKNIGNQLTKKLDLSNQTSGIYFIKINSKDINLIHQVSVK